MPIRVPFVNKEVYTKAEIDNMTLGAVSTATGTIGSRSKTDTLQWFYRGTLPSGAYLLREPLYDMPLWYPPPFAVQTDSCGVRVVARKANQSNIQQHATAFVKTNAGAQVFDTADALLVKISFYTAAPDAGKMKIEIGTEANFSGATQDVWQSDKVILDSTLITEYSSDTLRVDIAGRIVFRFAL